MNLPEGKNLVGAFYPPKFILTDPSFLRTLPHREFRSGLYEVVKTAVIADAELFAFLESTHGCRAAARSGGAFAGSSRAAIRVKAYVVNKDERESGLRQILNFGHTIGHALEAATDYRRFLHGEAIGWGMIAATLMAVGTGRLREREASRIIRLILAIGPLPPLGKITAPRASAHSGGR